MVSRPTDGVQKKDDNSSADGGTLRRASSNSNSFNVRGLLLSLAVVCSAVANRVTHRMQLSGPMQDYTFFIAQAATISYALVYSTVLYGRVRVLKAVDTEQVGRAFLPLNLRIFGTIGALEAVTSLIQLYCAARLPGTVIAILSQMLLPATIAISCMRGRRYTVPQILGAGLVIGGVLLCTLPTAMGGSFKLATALTYAAAYLLLAIAISLKERQLQAPDAFFDVFIVTTFSSLFQCLFTFALFPIAAALVTLVPALEYLTNGLNTFFFTAPYMPWLTFLYITFNLFFNIAALSLAKKTSATTVIMTNLFSVPLISLVFCLKLPLLTPTPFSWFIIAALAVIICGVLLYNSPTKRVSTGYSMVKRE